MDKVKCEDCDKEFSPRGIGTHRWRMHGDGINHEPNSLRQTRDYVVECKYCDNEFNYRSISRHEIRCPLNPMNIKKCIKCDNIILNLENDFCSRSCAAIYNNLLDRHRKRGPDPYPPYSRLRWIQCEYTGRFYHNRDEDGQVRNKSPYVSILPNRSTYKGDPLLYEYRKRCSFRFNVYDYPDYFELPLIDKHGWYSPSNKNNNLTGVSRDHMISVKYGYDNSIDPYYISHPANCRLILQNENSSKNCNISIEFGELINRISWWKERYGASE